MNKLRYIVVMLCLLVVGGVCAQVRRPAALGGAPEYVGYTQVYDFIEELADLKIISVNSVVKPYDRNQIAAWLVEAQAADSILSVRQRKELRFYLNDFALECEGMYDGAVQWTNAGSWLNKKLWKEFFTVNCQLSTVNGQRMSLTDDLSLTDDISLTERTERTEFYASRVFSPTDSTDLKDFLPFFRLRFKDRWFGFNDSLSCFARSRSTDNTDNNPSALQASPLQQGRNCERAYSSPVLGEVAKPEGSVNSQFSLSAFSPAFHYADNWFECKINPILGMDLTMNRHGMVMHRWYGAEIRADIVDHVAVWGSIRDHSYSGEHLSDEYFPTAGHKAAGAYLSRPGFMNTLMGGSYHPMSYGGDYAEIRAGIKAYAWWGSIGLVKDNLQWGDSHHSANILSGRAPSFPMIELKLNPTRWFRLDYIHGFLASEVVDSTNYYQGNVESEGVKDKFYRPAPKYLAANMLTFTPVRGLDLSVGSSIVYGTGSMWAAFSLPISFFNSIDHQLNFNAADNENSQLFLNISSRNLKYTHLYASVFVDEFSFGRLKRGSGQFNFFGWKVGARVSNWPIRNLSAMVEYTQTNPGTYEHLYDVLTYRSNGYGLGHYLGDNAREVVAKVVYKPVRGLALEASYVGAWKYNELVYGYGATFITRKPFDDVVWRSDEVKLHAVYEVVNNAYAFVDVGWNNARGFNVESDNLGAEIRLDADGYLRRYTPAFYWGQNVTVKMGFSFYY